MIESSDDPDNEVSNQAGVNEGLMLNNVDDESTCILGDSDDTQLSDENE